MRLDRQRSAWQKEARRLAIIPKIKDGPHFLLRLTLILSLLLLPLPVLAQTITGVASVTDGDSLEIHGTGIRLEGIEAPDSRQLCTRAFFQQWRCGQTP